MATATKNRGKASKPARPGKAADKPKAKDGAAGADPQDTKHLQARLNDLGYATKVDGERGPKTAAAIKNFQKDHGLRTDGQVGARTKASLRGATKESIAELRGGPKANQKGTGDDSAAKGQEAASQGDPKAGASVNVGDAAGRGKRMVVKSGEHHVTIYESESRADCKLPHAKMARKGIKRCPNCKSGLQELAEGLRLVDRTPFDSLLLCEADGRRELGAAGEGLLEEAVDLLTEAKDSLAKASTPEPFSHSKTSNWVARSGGLPAYVQHIAHDLHEKRGMDVSRAIAMAIGIVKRWARGGGNVDKSTRAAAAKAVAEWEALKAKNKARKAATAGGNG